MTLRYQFEGQSEDQVADIDDKFIVLDAVWTEDIARIIEEEEGKPLGTGYIIKYWDYNTNGYRRAKPKYMIPCDQTL